LRWLIGGSYLDICFAWGIGHSTFYHHDGILWPTLEPIDAAYHLIGLPFNDPKQLEKLLEGFHSHSHGILDGFIIAKDGFAVKTQQPFEKDTPKLKDYRFRKNGFVIIIIPGCDVDAWFIMASCNHSGSTYDIIALQDMVVFHAIETHKLLPSKYYIIGDEAFTGTNQVLSLVEVLIGIRTALITGFRTVGNALIGILTQHWGIFWRPFHFAFDRWSLVCFICM
jgi:hypothetical protein